MKNRWFKEPSLPLGKLAPTLINIANRFIYHLGGIEHENSIFMYDTFCRSSEDKKWIKIDIDIKESLLASRILSGQDPLQEAEEVKLEE